MKRERVFYITAILVLIGIFSAYYVSVNDYVGTLEECIATQDELIDVQSANLDSQQELLERMVQDMADNDYQVLTTTMTHEERVKAAEGATTDSERVQKIADALLAKIIKERNAQNEDTSD